MSTITIYSDRNATIKAAEFINKNMISSYLGTKGNTTYYNVDGVVWEVWQSGCGNYPTSNNLKVSDFKL